MISQENIPTTFMGIIVRGFPNLIKGLRLLYHNSPESEALQAAERVFERAIHLVGGKIRTAFYHSFLVYLLLESRENNILSLPHALSLMNTTLLGGLGIVYCLLDYFFPYS